MRCEGYALDQGSSIDVTAQFQWYPIDLCRMTCQQMSFYLFDLTEEKGYRIPVDEIPAMPEPMLFEVAQISFCQQTSSVGCIR